MRLFAPLRRTLTALSMCGAAVLGATACAPPETPSPPNLLLVTVDTLRADHTSAYGYVRDTTPALRKLAASGTLFAAAYAPQGVTAPSHATLFTGLHPLGHRLVDNGQPFSPPQPVLAERLGSAGYDTAAFVSSYPLKRRFGFARGFATFDDDFTKENATVEVEKWLGTEIDGVFDRNAKATVDRAIAWLEARPEPHDRATPFFLWTHVFDPHTPLQPPASVRSAFETSPLPPEYDAAFSETVTLYDEEILFTDRQVGRLLDAVQAASLDDSTLVVVTADHGEGLNEHGWWMHGVSVHEGELRIPLIIRLPGQTEARVVTTPTQLADLLPTLADWLPLGLDANPIAPATAGGTSLAKALRGEDTPELVRDLHFFRRYHTSYVVDPTFPVRMDGSPSSPKHIAGEELGLRRGKWKLRYAKEQREAALYDLALDPNEQVNVADDHKELTLDLVEAATQFADEHGREAARRRVTLDDDERAALEALGYVD